MATAKPKTFTLTMFLLKPNTSIKECLKTDLKADEHIVNLSDGGTATLLVQSSVAKQPRWVSFLAGSVADLPKLLTNSASAALFLRRNDRTVVLTFGYGRNFLRPGSWEEDFGLKVTLNSVDAEKIRSVDRVTLDAIGQHSRIQASREAAIGEFGLDLEQDLLRAVTGKPADPTIGKNMTGKDALRVTLPITLTKLPELVDRYLKQAESQEYKKLFPWVDQIHELKDPEQITQLDLAILERLKTGDFERLWLTIPEIIDWDHIDGFKYRHSNAAPLYTDVHVTEMLGEIDPNELSIELLKRRKISAIASETGEPLREWTWYRCLYAEVDEGEDTFLLTAGKWYKVGSLFRDRVNKAYAEIPLPTITLPTYVEKSERLYNERVSAEQPESLALFDRKTIKCDAAVDKIEFCDLFSKDKHIIHVKRYAGSSAPLSHLFAQALVSGTLFRRSEDFRLEVQGLLSKGFGTVTAVPNAREYEIVLGIVSKSKHPLKLPFFSRVNLNSTRSRLGDMGYIVSMAKIQAIA